MRRRWKKRWQLYTRLCLTERMGTIKTCFWLYIGNIYTVYHPWKVAQLTVCHRTFQTEAEKSISSDKDEHHPTPLWRRLAPTNKCQDLLTCIFTHFSSSFSSFSFFLLFFFFFLTRVGRWGQWVCVTHVCFSPDGPSHVVYSYTSLWCRRSIF